VCPLKSQDDIVSALLYTALQCPCKQNLGAKTSQETPKEPPPQAAFHIRHGEEVGRLGCLELEEPAKLKPKILSSFRSFPGRPRNACDVHITDGVVVSAYRVYQCPAAPLCLLAMSMVVMSSLSSLPAKPIDYHNEWLQTQSYPPRPAPQQQHHHQQSPAAIPLPAAAATKASTHTLRHSYDNVATISVHSTASNLSSPEACDCPSSNSSSASYSQPASPHQSIAWSSEIPVSDLGRVGATSSKADAQHHHRQERQERRQQHQHHVAVGDAEKQLDFQTDGTGDTRFRHPEHDWRHRWSVTACHRSSLANDCKIEKKAPSILVGISTDEGNRVNLLTNSG
jgi:hypothetical protein